jgi:hypothetical protein
MKPLLFSLLCLSLMAGCKKDEEPPADKDKTCPVKCGAIPIRLAFAHTYTTEEIDTVIIKKYAYGDGFTQLLIDSTYTLADTVHYTENSNIGTGFNLLWLNDDYDYEIIIPATAQTFRIWNVTEPVDYGYFGCDGKSYTCANAVRDCSVSGGNYEVLQYSNYPAYLQLKK